MTVAHDDEHLIADVTMGDLRRMASIMERAQTILGNMALENEGAWRFWVSRWQISDEPLRNDAKNLLPEIDELLRIFGRLAAVT